MRRHGCHPLNPPSFCVGSVDGEESHHLGWRQTRKERKNKHFGLSGGPVWWLLLAHVWPSHLRMITFTELSMARSSLEVAQGQKAAGTKIRRTFWNHHMHQRALEPGRRRRRRVSLCLKHSNRAIYTSRGLWSGSIMSSITVNDKNHPLGERYLIACPVTAASTHMISNGLRRLGLAATRIINSPNLTFENPQEARRELCIELRICTVFSTKQIILSVDRMLLQHPALQHWFTLLEHKQKQMSMI